MFMPGKDEIPINNGAVLNISQIIRAVMSSAVEAELSALFINAKTAVSIRQTLIELGHPQPRTPMQTDDATAHALLTNKILPKALLRCRDAQGFIITGDLGRRTWQITSLSITQPHTT